MCVRTMVWCGLLVSGLTLSGWAEEPPVLRSTGVKAGDPEQVLPAGAVVHVRAHNPAALAKALDEIMVAFIPEKALPPQARAALKEPMPALALLGMRDPQGRALSMDQLSQMFGIAQDRPVSLSLYVAQAQTGPAFILSLPMKDPGALTGLLVNALAPRRFTVTPVTGGELFDIVGTNPDLPTRMFVACSEDRVYLCNAASLAAGLLAEGPRLAASSPLIAQAIQQYGKEDLTVVLDPGMFKPIAAMFHARYPTIPPETIQHVRRELMRNIPPAARVRMDLRLRWQFGIDGIDQGLDYLEAFATGTYEVLAEYLVGQIQVLDGLVISVDMAHPTQRLRVILRSAAIKPAEMGQPIPIANVRTALALLPGVGDWLSISGRSLPAKVSPVTLKWLENLKAKFVAKKLPPEGLARFAAYVQGYQQSQALESRVPWVIQSFVNPSPAVAPAPVKTVGEYIQRLLTQPGSATLTMMPAQQDDFIEKHFTDEARGYTANEKSYHQVFQNAPWFNASARSQVSTIEGGVKRVVYESVYTSTFGLFGYNEHELINRKMLYYARQGDYVFMQQGSSIGDLWVNRMEKVQAAPLPPALVKLLDQIPADAVAARTMRLLHHLPAVVRELGGVEALIHKELDEYLAQAREVVKKEADNRDNMEAQLMAIEPPLLMQALCADPVSGDLYLLLPGNLRYPRPSVVPAITDLLKAYSAQADSVGGSLEYERVGNGEYEMSLAVNTDALAFLVKSVVNSYVETYAGPGGHEKLNQLLVKPGDGTLHRNQVLLFNTLWSFLYEEDQEDMEDQEEQEDQKGIPFEKHN